MPHWESYFRGFLTALVLVYAIREVISILEEERKK